MSGTNKQLRALRALLVAALAQLDALEERDDLPCDHPLEARDRRVADFGNPERWQCKRCGEIGGERADEKEG